MPIARRARLLKTACGVCLVTLAVVAWSWDVSGEQSVLTAYVPAPRDHGQRNQANTTRSHKQSCSPDVGHNNARNMLRIF